MGDLSGRRTRGRIAAEEGVLRDDAAEAITEERDKLGLPAATSLVVGSIVGAGVFLPPAPLAAYGTVGILAMGPVPAGAIALAVVFGGLGARVPAGGGPCAHAEDAFGEFPGFWNAWSFWLTAWIGNAAIAVVWMTYGAGMEAVFVGFPMMLVGIPVYIWTKAKRGEYGPKHEGLASPPGRSR